MFTPLKVPTLLLLTLALCLTGRLSAQNQHLNIFIWSEYLDPQIVADFERQFDCKVTVDLYEDEDSMMAKLQNGGDSLYDVVVPPDHSVPAMVALNLLAPLRKEHVPHLTNVMARFLNPPFDPGNRFTVPYQWGTVGLFVRDPTGKELPATWGLLFDPRENPGPTILIDNFRDMIGAALKFEGQSLNSTDLNQLKKARDLLIQAKKLSIGFEGGVGGKNKVLAKVATVAVAYSGDAVRGMKQDPRTRYLIPKEGTEVYVDNLAIPAHAPHRDLAEKFLNFILDAKVGARLSNYTQFASPNQAARPYLNSQDLKNPAIYPPPEVMERLEFLKDLGRQTRLYDEIWTQVKSR